MTRLTVEDMCALALDDLEPKGLLRAGSYSTARWYVEHWDGSEETTATIGVRVWEAHVRLQYQAYQVDSGQFLDDVNERIELVRSGRTGGYRHYFLCPGCGRRCRALFVPEGRTRFRCRACYKLAYRSQQERRSLLHRWVDFMEGEGRRRPRLKPMDVALIEASLSKGDIGPLLGKPGRPRKKALRAWSILRPIEKAPRGRPKEKQPYRRRSSYKHRVGPGQAYCVKCRRARRLVYAREGMLSNGRPGLFGRCRTCRTRLCRMLLLIDRAYSAGAAPQGAIGR